MSNVADRRIAELQNSVERLWTFIDDVVPALVAIASSGDAPVLTEVFARLAAVEARLPRPRLTAPPGWLGAKDAAPASGMSLSDFYRKWRKLGIIGVKFDRYFMFDPSSFPVRK